ncbi:MAG: 16S rRNA (adenine(1518)-N(6)/adenine(1519)-N(6))-dimethyltransferase, partial [Bacteroidaceae bacterium]|nr:16S rRNA (adenine(1518)-N(6)/adenine(1519)-N(6))-dimethyltransferase [Bacteroidaceae bacterium]
KSAVIAMRRNEVTDLGCDEALFKRVVKTTFNQRRKTLRNSIKPIVPAGHPVLANEIFNKRPEQLSVADFVELTKMIESIADNKIV